MTPDWHVRWTCAARTPPRHRSSFAPVEPPGLVTMASPTRDKLALFADRFRVDLYAVRRKNRPT
ncbi:hypothetical protein [Plantactinospora sp. B5E13]|uniref:hypothetical protein n=1 Tax=unclassified Plantactinospora TaxID=2631981 RepID=UPI00325F6B4D